MVPALTERAFELTAAVPVRGEIAEFGVWRGGGLETLARLSGKYGLQPAPKIYGFDTFAGIPASEKPLVNKLASVFAEGQFADTSLDFVQKRVPEALLVQGVFADVKPLAEYGIEKLRLVHLDGDIYEGYRDALALITPCVQVGTVILGDEPIPPTHWSRTSVREHGQRAIREWEDATGFNLHLIRFEWTVGLYVIVDEDYLRRHWRVIDRLRRDTIRESLQLIANRLLRRPLEARPMRNDPDNPES
jgi:hypothetical protein